MEKYHQGNWEFWQQEYAAENVESCVFRVYGRIFRDELGISGAKGEKLLDFGCGSGAAARFFRAKGFNVHGVDISAPAIENCRRRMPDLQDHFSVIDPKPKADQAFFGGGFDVVVGIQSMIYFSNADFETLMQSLHRQMKPGALIYATMVGTKCWYYDHSKEDVDGLRNVTISNGRLNISNYYVNFTHSEEHLRRKFHLFDKLHIGYYDSKFSEKEGGDFHYTFIGRKAP